MSAPQKHKKTVSYLPSAPAGPRRKSSSSQAVVQRRNSRQTSSGSSSAPTQKPAEPPKPINENHDTADSRSSSLARTPLMWEDLSTPGVGLRNDNLIWCNRNSIMQVIAHTPEVYNEIMFKLDHFKKPCDAFTEGKWCMLCAFRHFIQKLYSAEKPFEAKAFLRNLHRYAPAGFKGDHQQDAAIYLTAFVNGLQRCCLKPFGARPSATQKANTIGQRVFGGKLNTRTSCRTKGCGYHVDSAEDFWCFKDVSIIDEPRYEIKSVSSAVKNVLYPKKTEATFNCTRCKKQTRAYSTKWIEKAPKVMAVQIKRFIYDEDFDQTIKIEKSIRCSATLNLEHHVNEARKSYFYDLYAIVYHNRGQSAISGHYYVDAIAPDGDWYLYDSDIKLVESHRDNFKSSKAYIFFYRLRED